MPFLIVNDLKYHFEMQGDGSPLILLHGFTGSADNWADHVPVFAEYFRVITIDLPGHGLTDSPEDSRRYGMEHTAADVMALVDEMTNGERFHLLGYSMGGRLALFIALHYADRLCSLVLESASPGLTTEAERTERRDRDNALADRIERDGVEAFVEYWEQFPLFASQQRLAPDIRSTLRSQRLRNRPAGLANSLRGMGTGVQPDLWSQLSGLQLPVLMLTGELDAKFVGIGRQMYDLLPDAQLVVMPDAGHTVHLEQPAMFQTAVLLFLRGISC
jgi:2-succinyl-6-hydroxy-2,4-cyclohexadiene-1-carboxylate synthase